MAGVAILCAAWFLGTGIAEAQRPPASLGPESVTAGAGAIWVAVRSDDVVYRANPRTGRTVGRPIRVGDEPISVALGARSVWVANYTAGTVSRIGVRRGRVIGRPVAIGGPAASVAFGEGFVWAVDYQNGRVVLISPRTGRRSGKPIQAGGGAVSVSVGGGSAWVANAFASSVTRIDPRSRRTTTIPTPAQPIATAFGAGSLWLVHAEGFVSRIDPRRGRTVGRRYDVGSEPGGIAVGKGQVYVANQGDGTISRIDIRTDRVTTLPTPPALPDPSGVAVGYGSAWFTSYLTAGLARIPLSR